MKDSNSSWRRVCRVMRWNPGYPVIVKWAVGDSSLAWLAGSTKCRKNIGMSISHKRATQGNYCPFFDLEHSRLSLFKIFCNPCDGASIYESVNFSELEFAILNKNFQETPVCRKKCTEIQKNENTEETRLCSFVVTDMGGLPNLELCGGWIQIIWYG